MLGPFLALKQEDDDAINVAQHLYYGSIIFFGIVINVMGYRLLKLTVFLAAFVFGGYTTYDVSLPFISDTTIQSTFKT